MNSGNVILGTVGDGKRMGMFGINMLCSSLGINSLLDGTVIGNTVNVAARMLSLNKIYNTKFITTAKCISQLGQQLQPSFPSLSSQSQPSSVAPTPTPNPTPEQPTSPSPTPASTTPTPSSAQPPLGARGMVKKEVLPPPKNPGAYKFYNQRVLDTVRVPGKDESIVVHEIFDNESQVIKLHILCR